MQQRMFEFWQKHPALLLGLFTLVGTAAPILWHPIYIPVFLLLLLPFYKCKPRKIGYFALIAGALAFSEAALRLARIPPLPPKIAGSGVFHIDNLSILHSPFTRSFHYKGVFKEFRTEDGLLIKDLPCSIFHPTKKAPDADKDYFVEGILLQKPPYGFSFKPTKKTLWTPIDQTFSFAAWRYKAKKAVSTYIKEHIADRASATFLSALVTGEIDERSLRIDFSRLGLQHILAISGFHFSFFALACGFLLRLFLPFKTRTIFLIFALAGYFFFLGNSPSILRAFTAITIYLCAQLIKRRTSGLNALGAALILELFLNPQVIAQLSFQLSFLCTLALLLFSPVMHKLITFVLPKRPFHELQKMSALDKHGYIFSSLIRKSCAINLAVHIFSLPVLLHIFHKFPLLSLLYNLFFPFCVTISLGLLCLAFITAIFCPPLCLFFHYLNNLWTSSLLTLTSNPPAYFDFVLRTNAISFPIVILCLLTLFFIGIHFKNCEKSAY